MSAARSSPCEELRNAGVAVFDVTEGVNEEGQMTASERGEVQNSLVNLRRCQGAWCKNIDDLRIEIYGIWNELGEKDLEPNENVV